MISDIYNRPMFQTPERRAGGGIMAGVAPINQFMGPMRLAEGSGELGVWDWLSGGEQMQAIGRPGYAESVADTIGSMADDVTVQDMPSISWDSDADKPIRINVPTGEGTFLSWDKTEEGSGINARDVTDFLVFDPDDPVDRAIAASAAAMIVFPPGEIAVGLAKLGYTGVKAARALAKIPFIQKRLFPDGSHKLVASSLEKGSEVLGDAGKWFDKNISKRFSATDETNGLWNFLFRNRVSPSNVPDTVWDTVKGRSIQFQTNRFLGEVIPETGELISENVEFSMLPSAYAESFEDPGNIVTEEFVEQLEQDNAPEVEVEEGGIEALVTESAPEVEVEEGGITSLPTSIWQARDKNVKSPTFMRDGVPKAAVTVEDVERSGLGSLQNYLNAYDFDEDSGLYVERKAAGGIMHLAQGSGKTGLAKTAYDLGSTFFQRLAKARKSKNVEEVIEIRKELDEIPVGGSMTGQHKQVFDDALKEVEVELKIREVKGPPPTSPKGPTKVDDGESTYRKHMDDAKKKDGTTTTTTKSDKTPDDSGQDVGQGTEGKPSWYRRAGNVVGKYGTVAGAGYVVGDYFFNDTAEIEAALKAEQDKVNSNEQLIAQLKEALLEARNQSQVEPKDTTTEPPPPEGNIVQRMISKLKNFNPNQKGLYIAGQMMKPVEGWTPVNALTQATEAGIAYDKSQSELAKDAAAIEQTGTDLEREFFTLKSAAEKMLGRELTPTQANNLLLNVRKDMQSRKELLTIFAQAPHLINDLKTLKDFSLNNAENYIKELGSI